MKQSFLVFIFSCLAGTLTAQSKVTTHYQNDANSPTEEYYTIELDTIVIDEIHEFSNNQIQLLYLAKVLGKQIILLSATIDSKLALLSDYLDLKHLDFSGVRSFPIVLKHSATLTDVVNGNHNTVLLFGSNRTA